MIRTILIKDIKINRELRVGDDLSDLDPEVIKQPIVVRGNVLVDGLRRIELAKRMGVTELEAHDADNLVDMAEALALQHPTPMRDWMRVYQIVKALKPLVDKRLLQIRKTPKNFVGATGSPVQGGPARPLISKALGGVGPGNFETVVSLIEKGPKELVHRVLYGNLSPAGAKGYMQRRKEFQGGDITDPEGQLHILESVVQAMRNINETLVKIGPLAVNPEDMLRIKEEMYRNRSKITTAMNQLEEAAKK